MKRSLKFLGFIAILAIIGFTAISMIGCPSPDDGDGTTSTNGTPGGKTLDSIEVTPPSEIRYDLGEDLRLDGMIVTAKYSDGTEAEVTDYTTDTSAYDKTKKGNYTIIVTYKGKTAEFTVNVIDPNLPIVDKPVASPHDGTYDLVQSVTLTSTDGATIYYTLDGTTPTTSSISYSGAISINTTTTLKAFAVKEEMNDSDVLVAVYIIDLSFTTPPALELEPDNGKITYTWTPSDPAADSYDVYWKEGNNLTAVQVKTGTKITGATSGGEINGLTNNTAYSVVVTANKTGLKSKDSAVETATPTNFIYTVTGSDTAFTAKRGTTTIGTADQPIQTVINAIKTDANGNACILHFGDGTTPLDIGDASVSFSGTGWGLVELGGKITGSVDTPYTATGIIVIADNVSVTSNADIANTGRSNGQNQSTAFYNNSTGVLTISGGTVSSGTYAVWNDSGTVNISGGTFSASLSVVYNSASTGSVNISGGTVLLKGEDGIAVDNRGTLTISGGTISHEANADCAITNSGTLTISGGTVSTINGVAVDNNGTLAISGGEVKATGTNGCAVSNSVGTVTISSGEVKATGTNGYAVHNSSGKITVSGTALVTSANPNDNRATIYIANKDGSGTAERLLISGGTVENTSTNGNTGKAIRNDSTGTITISGGTVRNTGTGWRALYNNSTGTINISGGTVSTIANEGKTLTNWNTGAVNISGGTVSARNGVAVSNNSTGKITVSQAAGATTLVTSECTLTNLGTIYLGASTSTAERLLISGGNVQNNSTTTGNVIYNASSGTVNISGGTVSTTATSGKAILNNSTGTVNISAGTVQSPVNSTAYSIYNNSTGVVTVTEPPAVIIGARYPIIAETPTASPPAGDYNAVQSVILTTTTAGAAIYYTTNGTDPTTASTLYSGAISISGAITTLKAIAVKDGYINSEILTAEYIISLPVPGTAQWAKTVTAGSAVSAFTAIAKDSAGNVYAAGYQQGTGAFTYGPGVSAQGTGSVTNVLLVKYNSNGVAQWARTVSSTEGVMSMFNAVAVDASGNVYAAGFQMGNSIFTYGTGVTAKGVSGNNNIVLVKYDSNGTALWAKTVSPGYNVSYSDSVFYAVAVDASGNVYAAGSQTGNEIFDYGAGVTAQAYAGKTKASVVLVKYDSSGTAQWAKTVSTTNNTGTNTSEFKAVAVDASGNVYAAGSQTDGNDTNSNGETFTYGTGVTATSPASTKNPNVLLVKYDTNGTAQWAKTVSNNSVINLKSVFNALAVDASGNVYAAGSQVSNSSFTYDSGVTAQGTAGSTNNNAVLVKYNSSGTAQWAKTVSAGTAASSFNALSIDASGNLYAAGSQTGTGSFTYSTGITAQGTATVANVVLVKYNSSGTAQWAKTVSAGSAASSYTAATVDASGSVYAAGAQNDSGTYTYGTGVSAQGTATGASNALVVKYWQ